MIRGGKTIAIGATLILIGVIAFIGTFLSLARGGSSETQFKVPGNFRALVNEPGRYHLWDNRRTIFEGQKIHHHSGFPAGLEVTVHDSYERQLKFVKDDSSGWSVGNHSKSLSGIFHRVLQGSGRVAVIELGTVDRCQAS